jgi:hypothetical protein
MIRQRARNSCKLEREARISLDWEVPGCDGGVIEVLPVMLSYKLRCLDYCLVSRQARKLALTSSNLQTS